MTSWNLFLFVHVVVILCNFSTEITGLSTENQQHDFESLKAVLKNRVETFEGYQVLRIENSKISDEARDFLDQLYLSDDDYLSFDFWSPPTRSSLPSTIDVSIAPEQLGYVKAVLDEFKAPYEILIENLQKTVEESAVDAKRQEAPMSWDAYHPLNTIYNWIDGLKEEYPNNVEILEIGKSFENRSLKVVHISSSLTQDAETSGKAKPAIWLDGGIHAREWVSPATVAFIIKELLQEVAAENSNSTSSSSINSSGNSTENGRQTLIDLFDFFIIPVVNPDGYVYSWTNHRMWRKTRSVSQSTKMLRSGNNNNFSNLNTKGIWDQLFGRCVGTDPNRNFDYQWSGKGTSRSQCSDIYHGPKPASEPEIASVQNFILERKDQFKLFLTLHSYSQMILIPWGYDTVPNEDFEKMEEVALKSAKAIESIHGQKYRVGNTVKLLGPAAGSSKDWAKGVAGIKYSFAFELRDTGKHGFLLPAVEIKPTAEELMAGVRSMALDIHQIYSS